MWTAITFATIALAGTAFMLWFLVGLVREGALSVFRWVVAVRWEPEKEKYLVGVRSIYGGETTPRVLEGYHRYGYSEILEKEVYAKECASGLIALDSRPFFCGMGWRSIQPSRGVFHDSRIRFR
jgi:hypothetical protein